MVLSQPTRQMTASKEVTAAHELDGVGDQLAADQRRLHALGAHGNPVADGDGIELHRRRACGPDALLHRPRESPQMEIARHRPGPGAGYADERAREIRVAEAHCLEHGAGGRAVRTFGEGAALVLRIHWRVPARGIVPAAATSRRRAPESICLEGITEVTRPPGTTCSAGAARALSRGERRGRLAARAHAAHVPRALRACTSFNRDRRSARAADRCLNNSTRRSCSPPRVPRGRGLTSHSTRRLS